MPVQDTCFIDDFGPLALVQPQSVTELGEIVRRAAAESLAIYPVGGGTLLHQGMPPKRPGIAVDLRKLENVIDYPARDMTVTIQAGITMEKLQDILVKENQHVPVDVPEIARATLGGAVASNTSGPRRFGFGTFRDYVIGISVINDQGQETKAGGRVVKNVAGYDLCKLYTGSFGTLGIISQLTLKLRPLPEQHAAVLIGCDTTALVELLEQLHRTKTRPVCIDLLNKAGSEALAADTNHDPMESKWMVIVGFQDNLTSVSWQVDQFVKELPASYAREIELRVGLPGQSVLQALSQLPAKVGSWLMFKVNILPSATADFCGRLAAMSENFVLQAHSGNGVIWGHVTGDLTLAETQSMLQSVEQWASSAEGNVVIQRCPTSWKANLRIWGRPRGDTWLMRAIKAKLDPRGVFNPGRFIDGI